MLANPRRCSMLVLLVVLLADVVAAVRPPEQPQLIQYPKQRNQHSSNNDPNAGASADTATEILVTQQLQQGVNGPTRALAQSPEPWQNQDWVNQQIQAITNMIISVRNGQAPSSSGGGSSTTVQVPAVGLLPDVSATFGSKTTGNSSPAAPNGLNITSLLHGSSMNSSGSGVTSSPGQPSGNMSSITDDVSVLSIPTLPGTAVGASAANGRSNSSSPGPVAATAPNGSAGSISSSTASSATANSTSNVMQSHSLINITAMTAPAPEAAVAAPASAVQLLSLLTDLQPSNATSPFPKVDYGYNVFNTSGNMPLAVPVINIPSLPVSRWVLGAWSISNWSTPVQLEEGDAQDRRNMLLGNFPQLQPQQVQVAVTANVTVPLLFTGVEWKRAASKALQQTASDAAGGYTQAFVQVEPVEPDYGASTADFLNQELQYSGDGVSDKAVTLSYLPAPDSSDSSSSSSNARHMRLGRKLLQRQQQPPASAVVEPIMTRVWVQYQRVDASNVTTLLAALADAFSTTRLQSTNKAKSQQQQQQQPVWKLNEMTNLTGTMFGAYSKKLLHSRGAQLDNNSYAVFVNGPPVVTSNIRIATAITTTQTSPLPSNSTDQLVALWLANASNIVGPTARSAAPIGAAARVSWLLTPEVWSQPQVQPLPAVPNTPQTASSSSGLSSGATIGVAVAAAFAGAALLAGLLVYLADRRRKQQHEDGKDEHSNGSRRRRRRHHAKPRYLLPDPSHHPPAAADEPVAAAAAACVDAYESDLSADQLRAELRELGDSVTSAARFELHEQQSEGVVASDYSSAADSSADAVQVRVDHAQSSAAAAAAAGSSSPQRQPGVGEASSHVKQEAEYQTGRSATLSGTLELSDAESTADVSGDFSDRLVSRRGGWQPGSSGRSDSHGTDTASLAAAAAAGPFISPTTASLALTGASMTPQMTSHPSPAAAAAAVTAAVPCQPAVQLSLLEPRAWIAYRPQSKAIKIPGMQTPFANYAFDRNLQQGDLQPAAAAAAFTAAYAKDKHCYSSSVLSSVSSSNCRLLTLPSQCSADGPRTPNGPPIPATGCSAPAATAAAGPDTVRLSSASPVPVPPTPQPTNEAISLQSMSPQSLGRFMSPAVPTSKAAALQDESCSSKSSGSAISTHTGASSSISGSAVGTSLRPGARKSSPFACSYNHSLLAESAPALDSSGSSIWQAAAAGASASEVTAASAAETVQEALAAAAPAPASEAVAVAASAAASDSMEAAAMAVTKEIEETVPHPLSAEGPPEDQQSVVTITRQLSPCGSCPHAEQIHKQASSTRSAAQHSCTAADGARAPPAAMAGHADARNHGRQCIGVMPPVSSTAEETTGSNSSSSFAICGQQLDQP